jgi:HAD superfamily hydrolase (TIGR01509 family)
MLRALCIDLMGTVLFDPYLAALEAATGMEAAVAHSLQDPTSWPEFECGLIDEAEFVRRFFRDGEGCSLDVVAFHSARRDGYRFLPGMRALLEMLDGRLDRHIASNYPIWIEELRAMFDLDACCEGVWSSHQLGVRKPDLAFYQRLLQRVGHPASACLFVDDREDNCAGAEAAGMLAHHFDGVNGLVSRLRAEGVDVELPRAS